MAPFREVPQHFILSHITTFWRNLVRNYDGNVADSDFFEVAARYYGHPRALRLIRLAYTERELASFQSGHLGVKLDLEDPINHIFKTLWNFPTARAKCRLLLLEIADYLLAELDEKYREANADPLTERFDSLRDLFHLSEVEYAIFLFRYLENETCLDPPFHVNAFQKPWLCAMALDRSYGEVAAAMTANGRLRHFNLLDEDWDYHHRFFSGFFESSEGEAFGRRFYRLAPEADLLPWHFFGRLAEQDGELLCRLLSANTAPCNILLYGAPGTGKTSFARALAHRLNRQAYDILCTAAANEPLSPATRLIGVRLCNENEDPDSALMIVDEADELLNNNAIRFFTDSRATTFGAEKGSLNTLLDEMRIPTLWIANTAAGDIDESVRRRFNYAICFERLSASQRTTIWQNLIERRHLGHLIPADQITSYARRYETNAGGIALLLDNLTRLNPAPEEVAPLVERLMAPHCRLLGLSTTPALLPAEDYSLDGLNVQGPISPADLLSAAQNALNPVFRASSTLPARMTLLLFGPPGTGKTEFVKFLAQSLGRPILLKRGSDLLSKFVGDTEQAIADAFRQAQQENAILFFDEVDGLLQSRTLANASWEVTQVNEFLQQMEHYTGLLVAATNFRTNLDPAMMRRFTFKLEFDYLTSAGKRAFFERTFQSPLTPAQAAELDAIHPLAPGDFQTVRQALRYLASTPSNADRLAALRNECALKTEPHSSPIGF